jgi:hypothetical protein
MGDTLALVFLHPHADTCTRRKRWALVGKERMDKPESGKVYALTGGPDDRAISNGDSWAESEVTPESYGRCRWCGELKNELPCLHRGDSR